MSHANPAQYVGLRITIRFTYVSWLHSYLFCRIGTSLGAQESTSLSPHSGYWVYPPSQQGIAGSQLGDSPETLSSGNFSISTRLIFWWTAEQLHYI
jgi:hypothetical protein